MYKNKLQLLRAIDSGPEMQAFELETVSGAGIQDGLVKGSELVSVTTFAETENPREF
jgi:hypothetical protein